MNFQSEKPPIYNGVYQYRFKGETVYRKYVFIYQKQQGVEVYCSTLGNMTIEKFYEKFPGKTIEQLKFA